MEHLAGWFGSAASVAGVVALIVACLALMLVGWGLTLLGMPGNWLIAIVALVYNLLAPADTRWELGGWFVIATFGLAAVGEALESLAGAMGVARKGGSRRGAFGALAGSLAGAILGAVAGLPIPVPVVGSGDGRGDVRGARSAGGRDGCRENDGQGPLDQCRHRVSRDVGPHLWFARQNDRRRSDGRGGDCGDDFLSGQNRLVHFLST